MALDPPGVALDLPLLALDLPFGRSCSVLLVDILVRSFASLLASVPGVLVLHPPVSLS